MLPCVGSVRDSRRGRRKSRAYDRRADSVRRPDAIRRLPAGCPRCGRCAPRTTSVEDASCPTPTERPSMCCCTQPRRGTTARRSFRPTDARSLQHQPSATETPAAAQGDLDSAVGFGQQCGRGRYRPDRRPDLRAGFPARRVHDVAAGGAGLLAGVPARLSRRARSGLLGAVALRRRAGREPRRRAVLLVRRTAAGHPARDAGDDARHAWTDATTFVSAV